MSIYHKDKCTAEEITTFKDKVKKYLDTMGLKYTRVTALRSYNGEVRIYKGGTTERMRFRQGRKLVASRNTDGSITGESSEAIQHLTQTGGDKLYRKTTEPIEELDYTQVFRADDWEEEKKAIISFFREGKK